MKVIDIINLVNQQLQNIESFSDAGIEAEEIVIQFNKQYKQFITKVLDNQLYRIPPKDRERGFQANNRELEILRPLMVSKEISLIGSQSPKTFVISSLTPSNYLTFIKVTADISYSCFNLKSQATETKTKKVKVRIENISNIEAVLQNKHSKPTQNELVGTISGDTLNVYYENVTISKGYLDYIKEINPIMYAEVDNIYDDATSTHFELNDDAANEIIDKTIIALVTASEGNQQKVINIESIN